jgi:hypothetical protein
MKNKTFDAPAKSRIARATTKINGNIGKNSFAAKVQKIVDKGNQSK